jgi:hypothetical protein
MLGISLTSRTPTSILIKLQKRFELLAPIRLIFHKTQTYSNVCTNPFSRFCKRNIPKPQRLKTAFGILSDALTPASIFQLKPRIAKNASWAFLVGARYQFRIFGLKGKEL